MPDQPLPKPKPGYSLEATMHDLWLEKNSSVLEGSPSGQYLRNPIERAYIDGLADGERIAAARISRAVRGWITEQASRSTNDA